MQKKCAELLKRPQPESPSSLSTPERAKIRGMIGRIVFSRISYCFRFYSFQIPVRFKVVDQIKRSLIKIGTCTRFSAITSHLPKTFQYFPDFFTNMIGMCVFYCFLKLIQLDASTHRSRSNWKRRCRLRKRTMVAESRVRRIFSVRNEPMRACPHCKQGK